VGRDIVVQSLFVISVQAEMTVKGASKNSEFAQMQGAGEILPRRICMICKQEIFSVTQQLG